ncbi:hypothetical protein TEA_025735 [Camellia sinensis var. sinensis]|uniref:Uncharacterized protein n=1 Tax=Camellia sinensis var. sinensis TaxID=542762 RepID=A0A4S4DCW0_CAMSN|nr:hypothetical protein TEA_025735 [Camellia sinensis var. sinensis]
MISTSWGAPAAFTKGFNLQDVSDGLYGRHLHVYSCPDGLKQTMDLGNTGLLPLELRFLHDPSKDTGFVGCVLTSNMVRFFKTPEASWSHEVSKYKCSSCSYCVSQGTISIQNLDDAIIYITVCNLSETIEGDVKWRWSGVVE